MAYFRIKGFVGGQNRHSRGKQLIGGAGRARGGGGPRADVIFFYILRTYTTRNHSPTNNQMEVEHSVFP